MKLKDMAAHIFLGFALLVGIASVIFILFLSCNLNAAPPPKNEFIKGYDTGKSFLGPKKKKGKKYRAGVQKMIVRWKAPLRKFMRDEMVQGGSRAWLESRGNWYSHTKDTTIYEAGLMSNGYSFTRQVCLDHGVCGDPCGDPIFSIALAGYRRYLSRKEMFEGDGFWEGWLLEQAKDNRFEAEAFVGACGAINCQKLRMAIVYSGVHKSTKKGKDGKLHRWWKMMQYLRDQEQEKIAIIFAPKTQLWKIGSRLGRVVGSKFMQAEFFEQPESDNGHEARANFCWTDDLFYYPHDEAGAPVFPEPLYPTGPKFMKSSEWRKRCSLYGTKAWKKATGEPKRFDKYKKSACRDGVCWTKGRKYETNEEFEAAHAAWLDEMQGAGVLPMDADQAATELEMFAAGCQMVNPVKAE